ncbi:hypothetical protein J3R30DRAFT_2697896 [Lentinula aciculospora]|uniref:Uncharacterized protein n=1 Tax=Lentinula aciculospora TaxID=153920 RepID=A0A9W9ACL3_9AGAR|nr:hypothetical protein J3R30DRAFT_2697896 [Lentinula aciculospora]
MANVQHRITFPPFPIHPLDTVSFEDFKENGIKIQENDYEGPEVDALGIPTVPVGKRHVGDFCKTNSDSAKHEVALDQKGSGNVSGSQKPKTWMEIWEDLSTRKSGEFYDKNMDHDSRLHQATRAFNRGRTWPKTETHVREQWDQFQLYIGILNITSAVKPTQEIEGGNAEDDLNVDDDDDAFLFQDMKSPQQNDRKADRLDTFSDDPKQSVQVYLSSYMRKQGFHYLDRNLTLIPNLVGFYIKFLLKDEVFSVQTESGIVASLNEALTIVDLARTELPLTSQITNCLPWHDAFNRGCGELFNINNVNVDKSAQTWGWGQSTTWEDGEDEAIEVISTAAATTVSDESSGESDLEDDEDEIVTPIVEEDSNSMFKTSVHDNNASPIDFVPNAWESDEGTLESAANDSGAWGKWDIELDKDYSSAAGWGSAELDNEPENLWGEDNSDTWDISPPPTLFPILGPTVLPLTHTSGIVEWSMRRIRSIVHPDDALATSLMSGDNASAEVTVEADLSARLSKVEMEPWLDWETPDEEGDTALPLIQYASRGRVVGYEKGQGVRYESGSDVWSNSLAALASDAHEITAQGLPPTSAHDPIKHTITLLVDPETAMLLRVGMGLGATWVQIARQSDLRSEEEMKEMEMNSSIMEVNADEATPDESDIGKRFWYLSNLLVVLPSYHIVS